MSREIKFRYVIKYDSDKIQTFVLTLDEIQKQCGVWDEVNIFCTNVGIANYEIIARDQYTGLKDKNSKEIYEGDILHYAIYYPVTGKQNYFNEVLFDSGKGSFGAEHLDGEYHYFGSDIYQTSCVVIGNIYSNPEIINK